MDSIITFLLDKWPEVVFGGVLFGGLAILIYTIRGIYKTLNRLSCTQHDAKIEELSKDVVSLKSVASCKVHGERIAPIDAYIKSLDSIKNDINVIKLFLVKEDNFPIDLFTVKHSPRRLNEKGDRLLNESGGAEFLKQHEELFLKDIAALNPTTALDVESCSLLVLMQRIDEPIFKTLKDYVYNSPSFVFGSERYDLDLKTVCYVMSFPLRDLYLKQHPEIIPE